MVKTCYNIKGGGGLKTDDGDTCSSRGWGNPFLGLTVTKSGMHLARQNLAPVGALLFEKCARDFLSATTDIYPKVKAIYQVKSNFYYHIHGDQSPVKMYPRFFP